jgi:hypothetical protein
MAACVREPGSGHTFAMASLFSFIDRKKTRQIVYGKRIGSKSVACFVDMRKNSPDYVLRVGRLKLPFDVCIHCSPSIGLDGECDVYLLKNGNARKIMRYFQRNGIERNPELKLHVSKPGGYLYISSDRSVIRRSYEDAFICSCGSRVTPEGGKAVCKDCDMTYTVKK